MLREQKAEAQQVLDELLSKYLIPFKLSAYKMTAIGGGEYIVYFHDSRLPGVDFSWTEGECFKDIFRTAILARVKRLPANLDTSTTW
jgi:hypothetical protein